MIEYDTFIYLDVYRTGSTHVLSVLKQIAGQPLRINRHAPVTKAHPIRRTCGKFVFATVRNPWDWYVSLWAYGADGKSAIRRYLTEHLPADKVENLYDKQQPEMAFRRWLKFMHDPAMLDKVMTEYLPESGLAGVFGLYTYRFFRVTTLYPRLFLKRWRIPSIESGIRYHRRHHAYQHILRSEVLDEDLIVMIGKYRSLCHFSANAEAVVRRMSRAPRNASTRSLAGYREYYDAEARELVARRDRFFLECFGYEF
jgi:hypothetical protein